jgi:glycosyltransferase involved in cell wall biosynthesis
MNSANTLPACLEGVKTQTWRNIETIVIDGHSKDDTQDVAKKYGAMTVEYGPEQNSPFQKTFGGPSQWNYGGAVAKGEYLYLLASDVRLSPNVVEECVTFAENGPYDAMIVPEVSYGEGYWADCKRLQRSFFLGDPSMESPMFIRTTTWRELNGFDPSVGGYVDWDLTSRLIESHRRIGRIESWAYHYEGRLNLSRLLRKKYVYGKATGRYLSKHRRNTLSLQSFSRFGLLRPSYVKNFGRIVEDPRLGPGFILMTMSEYLAAAFGALRGIASRPAQGANEG